MKLKEYVMQIDIVLYWNAQAQFIVHEHSGLDSLLLHVELCDFIHFKQLYKD